MTTFQPMSFTDATAIHADGDRYRWDVPDGWQQGRGAFGGIVLGALVRAAEASEAERDRRVRVVSGELCGPVQPGPTAIRVQHLRRGSGVTYAEARLEQAGEVLARASVVLARDRKLASPAIVQAPPVLPPIDDVPAMALPSPPAPPCSRHFVLRPDGGVPFLGARAAAPRAAGWLHLRRPLAALDAAAIVGLCDAWWPALYSIVDAPRPMGTVSFTAAVIVDPATLAAAAPFAYRAIDHAADGGYVVEQRELWQDGRLVALNQQTIAIIA